MYGYSLANYRIAIVGAGISGITMANLLKKNKVDTVIYEKDSKIGGLIQCEEIDGNLFHKVGGHVFNAKNKQVYDWFWSFFNKEEEFFLSDRNAKILLDGKLISYPIENHLFELEHKYVEKIVAELFEIYKKGYNDPLSYSHFEAFLKETFGKTLFDLYFNPYNQKIWRRNLNKIPLQWLEGKLPMPDIVEIITNNIVRASEKTMVHSSFYYPKKGGSQFIIERLAKGLEIKLNEKVVSLKYKNKSWYINEKGPFDKIIYTADVRQLYTMLSGVDDKVKDAAFQVTYLKSNGTSNIFCFSDKTDLSWLYIPGEESKAHRIIYTGNFSPLNNSTSKRLTCVVEFSGKVDVEKMVKEVALLPGNLSPVLHNDTGTPVYNYQPSSYVIQEVNTRKQIDDLKKSLLQYNFFLTGRFAEWEYYNMDKAIESAMKLYEFLK